MRATTREEAYKAFTTKRVERVKKSVPILPILMKYGYGVRAELTDHHQQFSCDLHGNGRDSKPSARYYPEDNATYCFACGKHRSSFDYLIEKEGVGFLEALSTLEKEYRLPPLSFEWDGSTETQTTEAAEPAVAWPEMYGRAEKLLRGIASDIKAGTPVNPMAVSRLFARADAITHFVETGNLSDRQASVRLAKVIIEAKQLCIESTQ